jgi:hypothetical protein
MSPAGFELAFPTNERPRIHALDRAAELILGLFNIRLELLDTRRGGRLALIYAFFMETIRFFKVFHISARQCLQ